MDFLIEFEVNFLAAMKDVTSDKLNLPFLIPQDAILRRSWAVQPLEGEIYTFLVVELPCYLNGKHYLCSTTGLERVSVQWLNTIDFLVQPLD